MESARTSKDLIEKGRSLEQSGQFTAAAVLYERIMKVNPNDREAIKRLLMMYRRLKDFYKELSTIERALRSVADKNRAARGNWLAKNPQAAKVGQAILRSLGGEQVTAYGNDSFVQQLLKRKDLLDRKLGGSRRRSSKSNSKLSGKKGENTNGKPASTSVQGKRSLGEKLVKNGWAKRNEPAKKEQTTALSKKHLERAKLKAAADQSKKRRIAEAKTGRAAAAKKKRDEAATKMAETKSKKEERVREKREYSEKRKIERAAAWQKKKKNESLPKQRIRPSLS